VDIDFGDHIDNSNAGIWILFGFMWILVLLIILTILMQAVGFYLVSCGY
jgi:hypothetical protein